MSDILKSILNELPKKISSANFEGANIVLYTDDREFFLTGEGKIKEAVNKFKKRIELRADEKLLLSQEETEKTIREIVPKEAEITSIIFDIPRSIIIIEAKKPGLVIGKQGSVLNEVKKKTLWIPQIQRSPAIQSKITENIRSVLYLNNTYRRKFLNSIGKKIYKEWSPEKVNEWVRITFLGGARQVGRSCLLLHTPVSKILLDCGIDVAAGNREKFPYFDIAEFDISEIDAVIISHAHLDHCLPPHSPILTPHGYEKIDDVNVGDKVISIDWKTGKYIESLCIEKTKTTGHKKVLKIKTPYSSIESSPNHRFFVFENLKLKEIEASELKKGMLLPSNIKSDNTICLNTQFSISQFSKKVGFSSENKRSRLFMLVKENPEFEKENLVPFTPKDLRIILKQAGMLGRVHKSPRLSKLLPMCLLDLFRRKKGYATRKTVIKLIALLKQRLETLNLNRENANFYALRQLLSITRQEINISTGLKIYQIQQIEENKILSIAYVNLLTSFIREKLLLIIYNTQQNIQFLENLLSLNVIWERVTKIEEKENPYPHLVDIEVENHNFIAGNIIVHNSGLLPYLYKMGYKGPCYMTKPTRDIASLLDLDFIGVAYKKASQPLYSSTDIKEMVKHSICLDYNEVTDISPDIRLTLYNAGHALGSAMIHLNIGNGLHNLLYTADFKFGKTRLLDPATTMFPRLETAIIESTYGGKDDILPQRQEAEEQLIESIKKTIERKGKVLIPELGLGRAQETMLIIEDAIKQGILPETPIYIDGMIWDINAIHTAYPDFLSGNVRNLIFQDKNPFVSDIFKRVGSSQERKQVIQGGSCIVLATSGMLMGGASVEYFKEFAGNKRNSIIFVCYQGLGSLGRQVQEGIKELKMTTEGREEEVKVNLEVHTIDGLTAHAGRNQLLAFINKCQPRPKRVIVNHGEASKCLDLASTIYRLNRIETIAPRNLETIRIK